ncbi:MAG: hypothetical protein JO321_16955 [Solirubrobacterales bacterium]|nr:hypothetical protein [Solirubrobacterales bacterium]MBV8942391.1 hypothetical protein [Solirubrobacterales bacterium]MBV9165634.1 hypothetical protein [Solirubrobacterales bacterium]MBV9537088.1 hypothetical protein [Solirubrobacterales bacterium]
MRKSKLIVIVGLLALAAAACGSSSPKTTSHPRTTSSSTTKPTVVVKTSTIKPYGTVLVNTAGHALYVFAPDKATKVTCTGGCAKIWPPLALPSDAKTKATGAVKASLLESDPNPSGGRVVTYNHWPLYAYVADTKPGVAHGQGLKLSGGYWYLMSPAGAVIKSKKSSSSSSGYRY